MCHVVMDFWEGSVRKEDMPRRHLGDAHSQPHWSYLYTCLSPAFQVLDSPTRFQDVPLPKGALAHCTAKQCPGAAFPPP